MANYAKFVESVADEVSEFRENQQQAVDREELRLVLRRTTNLVCLNLEIPPGSKNFFESGS